MTTTNKEFEVRHGLVVAATTSATSPTTGSLIARGGAGIAENLYVGGNLFVSGTFASASVTATTVTVNNDTSSAGAHFITFVDASAGEASIKVNNSQLFYQPSTGNLGVGVNTFIRKFAVNGTAEISSDFFVGGNSTFTGDLAVNGGDITTSSSTFNIGNTATTAQTTNLATAATASGVTKTVNLGTGAGAGSTTNVNIGSNIGGTTTVTSPTTSLTGNLTIVGGNIVTAASTASNLYATTTTGNIGIATGLTSGTLTLGGTAQTGTITVDPSTSAHTLNIATGANASGVTKTVNLATGGQSGSTTNVTIGSTAGGTTTINSPSVVLEGSLVVNGTTTTVNSSTLTVDDKNIEIGSVVSGTISTTGTVGSISGTGPWTATVSGMTTTSGLIVGSAITSTNGTGSLGAGGTYIVASIVSGTSITYTATGGTTPVAGSITNVTTTGATDVTANGGGITLRGTTDKTINWVQSSGRWTFNQPVEATSIQNTPIGSTVATTGRFTTIQSTVATGTAPLIVASQTLVTNLNADLFDGNDSTAFRAFGTLRLDTSDAGYTWTNADDTTVIADTLSDTLSVVQGVGLTISVDPTNDAIRIAHSDTSSVANISSDNSSNTFIQDISFTFDDFGHVTAASVSTGTVNFTGINTFSSVLIDNTDTEYTWATADGSTVAAEVTSDSLTIVGGSGIQVAADATNDAIRIASTDTLQSVTVRGNTTTNSISITNATASTTTATGALIVTGGVGIGGAIYAGSIQNTPIGSTTRSSGAFTTLTANNSVTFNQGTNSTSTSTGTLVVTGGIGVSGNIYANRLHSTVATGTSPLTVSSTTVVTNLNADLLDGRDSTYFYSPDNLPPGLPTTSNLQEVTNNGNTTTNSISITNATASTTTATGALIVTGGVGIGGAANIGGAVAVGGNLTVSGGTITTGNIAATLLGGNTTTNITFSGSQTSGTLTIGGTAQTGTITIDRSTSAHTLNIATGSNASGVTKIINLGTGGQSGSTTNITIGSTGGGIITLNNPTLSGGPSGFIRRFDSGYSTTTTGGVLYEIGRFTFSANSQNISFIGEVRVSTGPTNGTTRFVLNARSDTLPAKGFTFTQEQLNFSTTVSVEVYQDTTTGLVVIGWRSPIAIQNAGWSLTVQERANYNFFTQTTSLTVLDTTGLTQVTGVVPGYSSNLRMLSGTNSTTISTGAIVVTGGVGISGDVYVGGTVNATDLNSTSDIRLKENIKPLNNSLEIIEKINPVEFNWKQDGKKSHGVIAQEIETVLPDIITTDGDGMKSVSYIQLIPFLIDVVKKQQLEIDELKKRLI